MALKIADLFVRLGADSAELTREFAATTKKGKKLRKDLQKIGGQISAAFAKVTVAATGASVGMAAVYKVTSDSIALQAKLADRLGTTAENLKVLGLAARAAGVDQEGVNDTLADFTERLGEARIDGGEPAEALDLLRLSAEELAKMDPANALREVLKAMEDLPDAGQRAATGAKLFGDQGIRITGLLSEEFDKAEQKITALGGAISALEVSQIKEAAGSISDLGLVAELARERFTAKLAPAVNAVAKQLFESAKQGNQLHSVLDGLIDSSINGLGALAGAVGKTLQFIDGKPELAAGGIIGYILGGKLGFLAVTAATAGFESLMATFDLIKARFDFTLTDADRAELELRRIIKKMELLRIPVIGGIFGLGNSEEQLRELEKQRREVITTLVDLNEIDRIQSISLEQKAGAISVVGKSLETLQTELENLKNESRKITLTGPDKPGGSTASALIPEQAKAFTVDPGILHAIAMDKQLKADELKVNKDHIARMNAISAGGFKFRGDLRREHAAFAERFEKAGMRERLNLVHTETAGALSALGNYSKKWFQITRALNIATAVSNTAAAVTSALKMQPFWPVGVAMAAKAALMGGAQIQAARKARFGSPGQIGGVDAVPTTDVSNQAVLDTGAPQPSVQVHVYTSTGASQDEIDRQIRQSVGRGIERGEILPETEIIIAT